MNSVLTQRTPVIENRMIDIRSFSVSGSFLSALSDSMFFHEGIVSPRMEECFSIA
jgi:hypothetical protein